MGQKKLFHLMAAGCLVFVWLLFPNAAVSADPQPCMQLSDSFDTYDVTKWQHVLLYSEAQGVVTIENNKLMVMANPDDPSEMQVYSLFAFHGDLDISIEYEIVKDPEFDFCSYNAGLVLQTLDDTKTYKTYLAVRPKDSPTYKCRVDKDGEDNLERFKGDNAPWKGTLRITRENGVITLYTTTEENAEPLYRFTETETEPLRLRLKLQTGDGGDLGIACPAKVYFDNFVVNNCDEILVE